MAFAYADPPYPGCAGYYPEKREVDYGELVSQLERSYRDGWALSLASRDLRDVLPLCPAEVRVGVWVRRVRYVRAAYPLSAWEPVIFCRGRPTCGDRAQRRLDLVEATGRFRALPGACVGMKPPGFCRWVFESLGAVQGDTLADLFPGSGAVTRAWKFYCRAQLEPGERDS